MTGDSKARLTFRLTDSLDPEERLEEAALWKALHDEYGNEIQAVTGTVPATFGRGVRGEGGPLLDYWADPAFHARCRRRFTTVPLDRVEHEVADLHRDGFGAFIKSTRSKHFILRVPIGRAFQEVAGAMAYSFIDGGPQLMVQELCEIEHEHRFFVINRRTETYSQNLPDLTPIDYPRRQTSLTRDDFWPLHELALSMARDMREPNAVVDVAYINGAPGIVELNPMRLGQVGLFACNVRALAAASRALLAEHDRPNLIRRGPVMDEQMIADTREWVVLPCKDRTGKHIASWDICTNQPEPDAIGVGVVASVYSGEATARAILAAVQAHSVMAGKVAELEGALRDLRENINAASLVRNPIGKRVRDRADAALAPYPERRSEHHE